MAPITASRTEANLQYGFANEILASRRFFAYAEQADTEGKHHAAALFREIAERKGKQARMHLELLEPVSEAASDRLGGETAYNVRLAIMSELHGSGDRYPGMARTARNENLGAVATWFETLAKASRSHANRFRRALETLL